MTKKATLVIKDYVNVKIENVDLTTRTKIHKALKFMPAHARHTPQFKLKRWDGKIAFATVGGHTYMNLLEIVLPILFQEGYEVDINDLRPDLGIHFDEVNEYYLSDYTWPHDHIFAGEPIILMEHQVNAINAYLKNPQSLIEASTSSGKTLITASMCRIIEKKTNGRTLTIVPSIQLVRQTEVDYKNIGLDVGVYFGEEKNYDNQHIITTWQSMVFLSKAAKDDTEAATRLKAILKDLDVVIVDEAHSVKGAELRALLCGTLANVPFRWGLTGTIPKEEYDYICLLCSIGEVVYQITAKELQDKGLISNCKISCIKTIDDHVEFIDYDSEKKFLTSDKDRIAWLLNQINEIVKTGNTLILVDNIDLGKKLNKLIPGSFFIYGNVDNDIRIEEFKKMSGGNNIPLIATFQTCSTGISSVRIFNIVLFEAGKSFTRVIQSIGRGLRKGGDKSFVNIFDFFSTLKYSSRHFAVRKKYYKDAQYPFTEEKVRYIW